MKILQIIQKRQRRGAEIFASQLASHLITGGNEVKMVTLYSGNENLPFAGEIIELNRSENKRFYDVAGWKSLASEIKRFNPDIVQANAADSLKFAVFSKLLYRWSAPLVFRNANKVSSFINSRHKRFFNQMLLGSVAHVISVSDLCRQDFMATYSYPEKRITTIPIGVEVTLHPRTGVLIDRLKGGKIVIHVASFVPEKNHLGVLRIVQKLAERKRDFKVLFIGEGKLRSAVEKQILERGISEYVFVLGAQEDVPSFVAHADLLILPSLIEGLPGVILEAMVCRTPVVAYDVGGVSEVVKNCTTGFLVPAGDEAAFIETVDQVLFGRLSGFTQEIEQNAYAATLQNFDNRLIAKRFSEAYERILKNNFAGRSGK